ncbi:MAG: tetratricopeptide repeat protein [Deltaproteobacteria bacterium]|nr:tetratricopeptide repeat protein [Deltaproteobacteria bacterium]
MSEHELWNELGNLYFMSGAYDQATHAYRKSIQIKSGFGRPYSNLALTHAQQHKYEEAIHLFRKGIELLDNDKEKAISWVRLGNVFRHLKNYREAVLAYQHADELDPESSENRDEPGQGLYTPSDPHLLEHDSIEESPDAGTSQRQAETTELFPDELAGTFVREHELDFQIPVTLNQSEQAVEEMPEASVADSWSDANFEEDSDSFALTGPDSEHWIPDSDQDGWQDWSTRISAPEPVIENIVDESCEDTRQTVPVSDLELKTYYQETERSSSVHSVALENENLRVSGRAEKISLQTEVDVDELPSNSFAILDDEKYQHFPNLVDTDADHVDVSPLTGLDHGDIKKIEDEIETWKQVVQLNPHNGFAWNTMGNLYKSVNRFKDAALAYQQAISTNDGKASYYHNLGLAYAAEGRYEDAVSALQKVIELDPGHSLAHAALGGYYRKMGLDELAQKHIGKAMKSIFDSENEYNRACLEAICGNADQAIDLLRIALEKKQTYIDWMLRDPDLDFIRQDARFKQLISDFAR